MAERAEITVRGVVQGVGFRPFVYSLAISLNLRGYVTNTSGGVRIDVEGDRLSEFIQRLSREAPPLSQIREVLVSNLSRHGYPDFRIRESRDGTRFTLLAPDISICDACLKELFTQSDRRYRYPFINCTNCGPRYSITRQVPYDRPNTTMGVFEMCPECSTEYGDPLDRRFHAEPNACPLCGPHVEWVWDPEPKKGQGAKPAGPIEQAVRLIRQGGIVALKGIGGFHITCDAANEEAVRKLRGRKRKSNKPFALMASGLDVVERFCNVSDPERRLLLSQRRPVVLLKKREDSSLPEAVAPNNRYLGFMLPYTPLHYLLFQGVVSRAPGLSQGCDPLVMTSGNLAEEPIVRDNHEALRRLSPLVDAYLLHDREIFMRVDDSVLVCSGQEPDAHPHFMRRARGYCPEAIDLGDAGPEILAAGADLKNTFTLTKGGYAIMSQHIGDLENFETLAFFEESLENLKSVYRVAPAAVVHDLHPDYLSTRWALAQQGLPKFAVQHHYAHIASVMAEKGLKQKVMGVAFDGTGYGTDGTLWGGEFLLADLHGFERAGHLAQVPLPGGDAASREPWRSAVSYLAGSAEDKVWDYLERLGFVRKYGGDVLENLLKIIGNDRLSPLSSGAGRLFDAVAALIGICDRNTFEAEAAMALESLASEGLDGAYSFCIRTDQGKRVVDTYPMIRGIVDDLLAGKSRGEVSAKFHNTLSEAICAVCTGIRSDYGINDVVLSGGTFQNMFLAVRTRARLSAEGLNVVWNRLVPCNDGGVSLGQAYLIRERLKA